MTWGSTFVPAMVTLVLFFLPGMLVACAARLRGMALVAIAPLISVTLVSVAAILAPLFGMRWSVLPVAALAILVSVVAFLVARISLKSSSFTQKTPWHWKRGVLHAAAVVIAAILIGRRLVFVFGRPDSFSQTFDNVFHLNAIRYILDTGSASSVDVSGMTGGNFYPAAWHGMVSLGVQIFGGSIPATVNLTNIVIGAVVWPLGCIFLAHQVLGRRGIVSLVAGILSAGFGAFPILLLDFGVLYPNFLGNALLPGALGLAIQALGLDQHRDAPKLINWLLFVAVLPGIILSHPSSLMALLALCLPPLLLFWVKAFWPRVRQIRTRWRGLLGLLAALLLGSVAVYLLWKNIRPPEEASSWLPVESTARAIGEVVASAGLNRPVSWVIMVLVLVGIYSLILRRHQFWLLGIYFVMAALFVVVASFPLGEVRTFLTGVWYNDPPRLASLLPLVILPVATVGAVWMWDWLKVKHLDRWVDKLVQLQGGSHSNRVRPAAIAVSLVVLLAILTVGTQQANVREAALTAAKKYELAPDSKLISSDEMALIERLDQNVPEGAILAGNPWNGSALAYAFADRKLLQLHILSVIPDGAPEIYDHLKDAKTDPEVCPAVKDLKVTYVLDFGHQEVSRGDNGFRGLDDLAKNGVATLVDAQGDAKLYKISAC